MIVVYKNLIFLIFSMWFGKDIKFDKFIGYILKERVYYFKSYIFFVYNGK